MSNTWTPEYAPWRHGGWYVTNVHYPSGAIGCVSRNYSDGKWRIACSGAYPGSLTDRTFRTRDDAARAERELTFFARAAYGGSQNVYHPQDIYETGDEYAAAREDLGMGASEDTVRWLVEQRAHIAAVETQQTQLPPVSVAPLALPLDEPVNVPADPDVEPQSYDMPSPEADALDRIVLAWRDSVDEFVFAYAVKDILRETGRLP